MRRRPVQSSINGHVSSMPFAKRCEGSTSHRVSFSIKGENSAGRRTPVRGREYERCLRCELPSAFKHYQCAVRIPENPYTAPLPPNRGKAVPRMNDDIGFVFLTIFSLILLTNIGGVMHIGFPQFFFEPLPIPFRASFSLKKYFRMSLSMPIIAYPFSAKKRADSDPMSPADP